MSTALAFPGQGAQHIGMGADVADRFPAARRIFERASAVLGLDLLAVCRHGPESELLRTDVQQPAILAVGAAVTEALRGQGETLADLSVCFGLSLGEFTALYAAGALELEDALVLVRERGLGMQEASEAVASGMLALRCEIDVAEGICATARAATGGVCALANLNAPGQVVISGDLVTLDEAERVAAEQGVRRPVRLPVSGAFHSPLMQPGAARLERALAKVTLARPRVPVISNVTAAPSQEPAVLRANLIAQVTSPVRFADCVRAARALGVQRVIEPAPGRVLAGLIRRTEPDLATQAADRADAVAAFHSASENA